MSTSWGGSRCVPEPVDEDEQAMRDYVSRLWAEDWADDTEYDEPST